MFYKNKLFKEESGQALILVALLITVLMGFTALTIDLGRAYVTKSNLQKAADAAALAGAHDLSSATNAKATAINYAEENGVNISAGDTVTPTAPYIDPTTGVSDKTKIQVVCTRKVSNIFARVLGLSQTDVKATAVAQNNASWDGESLPFLNVQGGFSEGTDMNIWEKVDDGYFESILKYDVTFSSGFFKIDYSDGIEAKSGKLAEGSDNIKTNLADMWSEYQKSSDPDKYIYVFSLSNDVFAQHFVDTNNGRRSFETAFKNNPYPQIGQNDNILLSQLVLLECKWTNYSETDKIIQVTYHATYDLGNNGSTDYPDYPSSQGISSVGHIKLVK